MKPMTMRERMLGVIQGRQIDRVPFVQYDIMVPAEEAWGVVGRENLGLLRWTQAHRFENPHCRFEREDFTLPSGTRGFRQRLITPEGTLTEEQLIEPVFNSPHPSRHFIQDPDDYKIFLAYLRDITVVEDFTPLLQTIKDLGEDGLPHCWVGRSPYQQLWVQWVSIENLALHMMLCPEIMEEVFAEMGRVMLDIFKSVRHAPMPYVVVGDNITAPMIGEAYFRQYCLPYYHALADVMDERDVPVVVHMDGDLKPLWNAIGESRVRGLDSFSPPPDNDTSAAAAAAMWPEMRLLVNFPSSVHLHGEAAIRERADQILEEAGHNGRLWIQVSENVPPGIWRKSYPVLAQACAEFRI